MAAWIGDQVPEPGGVCRRIGTELQKEARNETGKLMGIMRKTRQKALTAPLAGLLIATAAVGVVETASPAFAQEATRTRGGVEINRVVIEGNKKFKKESIQPELQSQPRRTYDPRAVEADVQRIKDFYRRIGRGNATVSSRIVQLPNGRVDVVFTADEGAKTGVVSINFAGNVPVNVPQTVSNIWATWGFATDWSANAGIQIVGKRYGDNANTIAAEMPSYTVVNAGLQWKPDRNTTVALRVYNLLDTVYATSGNANVWLLGMPRTAQLAVNVKF
jgi:hypothetical protein